MDVINKRTKQFVWQKKEEMKKKSGVLDNKKTS